MRPNPEAFKAEAGRRANATPQTLEKAMRRGPSPIMALYHKGKITPDQLWAAERIEAAVRAIVCHLDTRVMPTESNLEGAFYKAWRTTVSPDGYAERWNHDLQRLKQEYCRWVDVCKKSAWRIVFDVVIDGLSVRATARKRGERVKDIVRLLRDGLLLFCRLFGRPKRVLTACSVSVINR